MSSSPSSPADSVAGGYRRVLLKISGEALMGGRDYGLDPQMVEQIAGDVKAVRDLGVEVCVVIGGGNIFRGLAGAASGMERATADYMGMLATVINSLAMQMPWSGWTWRPGSNRLFPWPPWRSPISGAGRCATWRRAGW